jgi:hypothetical protein
VRGIDGPVGPADLQSWPGFARFKVRRVGLAIKTLLSNVVPRLDLDETDVEKRVLIRGERQRTGNVDGTDRLVRVQIVNDDMTASDLNTRAGFRDGASLPSLGSGPRPTSCRTD